MLKIFISADSEKETLKDKSVYIKYNSHNLEGGVKLGGGRGGGLIGYCICHGTQIAVKACRFLQLFTLVIFKICDLA